MILHFSWSKIGNEQEKKAAANTDNNWYTSAYVSYFGLSSMQLCANQSSVSFLIVRFSCSSSKKVEKVFCLLSLCLPRWKTDWRSLAPLFNNPKRKKYVNEFEHMIFLCVSVCKTSLTSRYFIRKSLKPTLFRLIRLNCFFKYVWLAFFEVERSFSISRNSKPFGSFYVSMLHIAITQKNIDSFYNRAFLAH